jgi:hypothetical protein
MGVALAPCRLCGYAAGHPARFHTIYAATPLMPARFHAIYTHLHASISRIFQPTFFHFVYRVILSIKFLASHFFYRISNQ